MLGLLSYEIKAEYLLIIIHNKVGKRDNIWMKLKIIYTLAVILQVYKLIKVKKTIKYYQKLINKITSLDVLSIK